ncbi:zinc finger protein 404-like isoform X2 [Belonocnema kinseyi]|uniref:zinc finger protein 404-like isoform X2 n=1 Tax=Belonocnema kinseyi TaxID=2817044 RepID=UPI00143DF65F|nr:zinc finger protein 404-like isoform X2 [Belonocnema kinseyi]
MTLIEYDIDKTLEIKEELITDEETVVGQKEKKYACEKCARSYIRKTHLDSHKKFGCGVMPQFSCQICGRLYRWKNALKHHISSVHQKADSKISPVIYNCDKCTRSYRALSSLHQHKRVEHAAVKPQFFCYSCEYKTNRKSNLSKHITSRHSQTLKIRSRAEESSGFWQ